MSLERLAAGLTRIDEEPLDRLDAAFLEDVILGIGLHPDSRGLYGEPGNDHQNPEQGLWQLPGQLAPFLEFLGGQPVASFLEVGTFSGYTTSVLDRFLRRRCPSLRSVSIDPNRFLDPVLPRLWEYRHATSEELRGAAFDLVFIDGDHAFEPTASDYANVGRYARICAFHDINDHYVDLLPGGGVGEFWRGLAGDKREFCSHPLGERIMGIGALIHQ